MNKVTVSAPGKLMLLGEHAVVYGQPCLVTAVDQRLFVEIGETGDGKVTIKAPESTDTRFVEEAIGCGVSTWKIKHQGLRIKTTSPFSGKYGFGSSAAVTVATLAALASLFHQEVDKRSLFELAYQVILSIQTVGSGFDVAAAVYGGTLFFTKGGTTLAPISINDLPLVVGYTGVKSNTVEIVKQVAAKREKYPEKVDRIFEATGKLVIDGKKALEASDWERVGKLMDFNQEYLRDLGVSSEKLEVMISAAKTGGAWGAKLSGAGGGDCMIALAGSDKREVIRKAIEAAGGQVIDVRPNAEGVRVET